MPTTKLTLSNELGIFYAFVTHLRTLVAMVPGTIGPKNGPALETAIIGGNETSRIAFSVHTLIDAPAEWTIFIYIEDEDVNMGTCRVTVACISHNPDQRREVSFNIDVGVPRLAEEAGLQLAIFATEYFRKPCFKLSLLDNLETKISAKVAALARTIPI